MSEEMRFQQTDAIPFASVPEIVAPTPDSPTAAGLTPPDPPSVSIWHRVFIGPSGLRPGWGLLLYIVLFASLGTGIGAVVRAFHHPPKAAAQQPASGTVAEQKPQSILIIEGISVLVVSLTTFLMGRIERRRVSVYGFGGTRRVPHLLAGFGWGAVFLSVLVGALWKSGLLVFDGRLLFGASAVRYGLTWVFGFLLVGLFEEYLLRGYLQYTLSRGFTSLYNMLFDTAHGEALGFWTAAVVLSALFGLGHGSNPGESPIGLLSAGLVGLVFCLSLWRTGSLWWALGFHASWDWAQSFLFGVADSGTMVQGHLLATHAVGKALMSGGATGPEGSLFVLPVLAGVAGVILLTLPARRASERS